MEAIKQLQEFVPWMSGLPFVPKIIVSTIIVLCSSLILVLVWTPPPGLSESDRKTVGGILKNCYRRSLFTRTHAQTSHDAMVASIAECRKFLQRQVPDIESAQLQQLASNLLATLDNIERFKENEDPAQIDPQKLEALRLLSALSKKTGIPYSVPKTLIEDAYFSKEEADQPPRTAMRE